MDKVKKVILKKRTSKNKRRKYQTNENVVFNKWQFKKILKI